MQLNKYVRKLKGFKMKDNSQEGRDKMATWLLSCLKEEGDTLIKSQVVTKEQVIEILYLLEDKWLEICRRVPKTLKVDGWREFVFLKWQVVLLPKEKRN